MSIARRAASDASSTQEAIKILRGNWLLAIEQHHIQYSESSVINDILDIGCSIGISTRYLADKFLTAKVTGLDLSPYFLAVAKHKEKRAQPRKFPIRWIHANGEDTGLPSKSFNLVSIAFVFHECELSPVLFTLYKCTEPFIDEFYLTDMDETLREAGLVNITSISASMKQYLEIFLFLFFLIHKHRLWFGFCFKQVSPWLMYVQLNRVVQN
ncbi:hypothetical protein glysoja_036444 [Glycine soja]|uniref:Methyltransferase type 11 domain-containing protein n=1 Tax=Glycine soja TaxID=3848 RepID=A0A0B2PIL2_GLYSO|nr:hypothetical protein glysoja_036444 [Glycine soja]